MEKEMANFPPRGLAWEIPLTEEPADYNGVTKNWTRLRPWARMPSIFTQERMTSLSQAETLLFWGLFPPLQQGRNMHEMKEGKTHLFWVNSVPLSHKRCFCKPHRTNKHIFRWFLRKDLVVQSRISRWQLVTQAHSLVTTAPAPWVRDWDTR